MGGYSSHKPAHITPHDFLRGRLAGQLGSRYTLLDLHVSPTEDATTDAYFMLCTAPDGQTCVFIGTCGMQDEHEFWWRDSDSEGEAGSYFGMPHDWLTRLSPLPGRGDSADDPAGPARAYRAGVAAQHAREQALRAGAVVNVSAYEYGGEAVGLACVTSVSTHGLRITRLTDGLNFLLPVQALYDVSGVPLQEAM